MNENDKVTKSWEKLMNPKKVTENLLLASLYLLAFEILMDSVIKQLRDFYLLSDSKGDKIEIDNTPCGRPNEKKRPVLNERYKTKVKNLYRPSILCASCLWLENNGVIAKEDAYKIDDIRRHRNSIAHELPNFLGDVDWEINLKYFESIRQLLQKIDTWWIKEVYMIADSNFDGVEVKEEDIQSGRMILLDHILESVIKAANDNNDKKQA